MSTKPTHRIVRWQALRAWLAAALLVLAGSQARAQETLGDDNQGGANLSVRGATGSHSNVQILEAAEEGSWVWVLDPDIVIMDMGRSLLPLLARAEAKNKHFLYANWRCVPRA